ncbi:hypothetical protein ViNHUV68_18140 [Vibrio sp. NH-UV-68]
MLKHNRAKTLITARFDSCGLQDKMQLFINLTKLKHALEPVNYQVMYEMLVLKNAK